ncbi:hypothetical protein OKW38_007191 [Paraburkholderia sp. MM5496-R1]|uniref:hypothetical protein n=1 Tax=Paraburkholderia sp. MM5496-R1 TaxID=2991065 RepID=UPI003D1AACFC
MNMIMARADAAMSVIAATPLDPRGLRDRTGGSMRIDPDRAVFEHRHLCQVMVSKSSAPTTN